MSALSMEERRKADRRDPGRRYEMSPETLQLLRFCGASVRVADDPARLAAGVSADRRRSRQLSGAADRIDPSSSR
jgi:hypothetical protein